MRNLGPEDVVAVSLPTVFGARRDDVANFHVLAVLGSVIALEPLGREETNALPELIRDCFMTYQDGRTVVSLRGHLFKPGVCDWRFKVTDSFAKAESCFRIRFCAPLTVSPVKTFDAASHNTQTINLGPDGALIDGSIDWSVPEQAILTLSLPDYDEPIQAPAVLIARHGDLCDYTYETMDTDTRNRLCLFIIECQRARLRMRKQRLQWARIGTDF